MLWYKAWLETRWRFVIGFVLLMFNACGVVIGYPQVQKLMPLLPTVTGDSELARRIREAADLAQTYHGYVWANWIRQNLTQSWVLFALLLGTGGLLAQASGGGALFTLSLPVTRARLVTVRALTGLAELLVLAVVPTLLVSLLSPAIGQTYRIDDALVYSACVFAGGTVFFSLTSLLSTVFNDIWRPFLLGLGVALILAITAQFVDLSRVDIYRVMSAESYFRAQQVPWLGLAITTAISTALLYAATKNIARQDF